MIGFDLTGILQSRLCDGRHEIDNNGAENAIRPFRSRSPELDANSLEAYAYLRHLFTELPEAATTAECFQALLSGNIDTDQIINC